MLRLQPQAPISRVSGLGLLDLMLVVAILAILAAIAIPVFRSDDLTLDRATRQVVADMFEAQSLAIESRMPVGLRFDQSANSYVFVLENTETPATSEAVLRANPNLSKVEVERLLAARTSGDPQLDGATLTDVSIGGGGNLIFEADGAPRADGLIDLARNGLRRRVRIQVGGGRIAITEP